MALRDSIIEKAKGLGINPHDLATAISYETGGTFSPNIRGGAGNRHIGLIQFGKAEQAQYGARQGQSADEQMDAVARYLKDRGVKPGMGLLDIYSTINAGRPGRYDASDAGNGGAPGNVRDKVTKQMGGHQAKASALLGGEFEPSSTYGRGGPVSAGGSGRSGSSYMADDSPADETIFARLAGTMGEQTSDPRRLELRKIMADVLDHPDVQALIPQQAEAEPVQQASPSGGFAPPEAVPLPPPRPEGLA